MKMSKKQKRKLVQKSNAKQSKAESIGDSGLKSKEEIMKASIFDRQKELFQRGLNNPDLQPDEKMALMDWQELMKQMKDSSKLFTALTDAAKESPEKFQQKVGEFYTAILFIQARTSDAVLRLAEMSEDILTTLKQQQDLYEKQREENNRSNKESNKKAKIAIWIAVASILASVGIGIYFGREAHSDSEKSSAEIVNAIKTHQQHFSKMLIPFSFEKPKKTSSEVNQ